jgi:hypothetical protein
MLKNQAFVRAVSGWVLEGYGFDAGRSLVCRSDYFRVAHDSGTIPERHDGSVANESASKANPPTTAEICWASWTSTEGIANDSRSHPAG